MNAPLVILALLTALACTACDKASPMSDTTPRPFMVDGEGAHYIVDTPKKGLVGAAKLASIPSHQRGVVRVRHDSWPALSPDARGSWVVDLIGAVPGDALLAHWRSERQIVGGHIAQNRAYHLGLDVHFVASELAVVHPTSDRNKRALKLRQLLPKQGKRAKDPSPSNPVKTP